MSIPGFRAEPAAAGERFGPNSGEVEEFIQAAARLTPGQWRKVLSTRQAVSKVVRDGSAQSAEAFRALLHGVDGGAPTAGEPMAALAAALGAVVKGRSDDEVAAAWSAASALVRRRQLAAVTFAAHYLPFAAVIPPVEAIEPLPSVLLFARSLKWLTQSQWELMALPWTPDREVSTVLMQAAARAGARESEEVVALAALAVVSKHLSGDLGWAAVKTAVHAARVLSCRSELTPGQLEALWTPLEHAVPLRSLEAPPATTTAPAAGRPRAAATPRAVKTPARKRGALYGPNSAEVTAFIKVVRELTAIQWLRVLDRRQLVASVAREGSAEPAAVVRATLAAITATRAMELDVRCRVVAAVERAGYALAHNEPAHYGVITEVVPFEEGDAAGFAGRLSGLNTEEWTRLASVAPAADADAVAPMIHAGDALAEQLVQRTDDDAVVTWSALTALLGRHRLSPIKFAVSYAPFASAAPVTKPRTFAPPVQRYLTAIGRLSAHQCTALAEPWMLADDISNSLSRAVIDGSAKAAEEAAALAALVTIPMRLSGNAGWAAAKTAIYGARAISARGKLSAQEFDALWKPVERAIPLASLDAAAKSKR